MGNSTDREAVVDSHLRVRGIRNLRVIDASIMPKIINRFVGRRSMLGYLIILFLF